LITVFYARYAYLNPGFPLFLQFLRDNPPQGIRAINVSQRTPAEIERLARESSTIVIDQSIENAATWAEPGQFSIYRIRGDHPTSFFSEISDQLWSVDARRLFMSNFDLHDLRVPALMERMRGKVDAVSWMFEKRPRTTSDVPAQYRDPWNSTDHDPLGTWNLIREVAPVRIELPFAIAAHELANAPVRETWDTCVPGAPYATRTLALSSIRRQKLTVAPARGLSRLASGVSRILGATLPSETASLSTIVLQQRLQRSLVRSSATTFVCGSGVAFATRKFFEVPALRSPMLAYPCVGFDDYGFSNGINVVSTIPEDAGKQARWLRSNPPIAERIARAGQEMIIRLHKLDVRVESFAKCLRKLDQGKLNGAAFQKGQYEIY